MKLPQKILSLSLIVLLGSCSNIVFNEAVPQDQDALNEFPKEIQGLYLDAENDTLEIFSNKYAYGEMNGNTLLEGELGSDLILKQFEAFYFLNFKNDHGFWEMIAAQKTTNGLKLMCIDIENKTEVKNINKHIKKGKAKSLKNNGKFLINPDSEELLKILNDTSICDESRLVKINK